MHPAFGGADSPNLTFIVGKRETNANADCHPKPAGCSGKLTAFRPEGKLCQAGADGHRICRVCAGNFPDLIGHSFSHKTRINMATGNIRVSSENIFPIIKKFLYSDHEIFIREMVSNAVDATRKLKTLASVGEFTGDLGEPKI